MAAVLHGKLEDFGIADVLQLIGQQRKTGFLQLEHEAENIRIVFEEGCVVSASPVGEIEFTALGESLVRAGFILASDFDRTTAQSRASARPLPDLWLEYDGMDQVVLEQMMARLTQETLFQVMGWSSGAFHFSPTRNREAMIEQEAFSVEKVLMDGLRMLDEWRTFPIEVQTESHVFRIAKNRKPDSEGRGDADEILSLLDGHRSVRQVIDASRRTTFEVGRHLSEAFVGGRIETEEAASAKKNPFLARSRSPWLEALRWVSAATLPLAFLALVVGALSVDSAPGSMAGIREEGGGPRVLAEMKFARLRRAYLEEANGSQGGLSEPGLPDRLSAAGSDPRGTLAPESLAAYSQGEQRPEWVQAVPQR
ncbi:MAG: DUF4388 domain-containing protein [Myxococcota bacterium]